MVFFTADHHFYHQNIIKYCNRPFESVEEMNNALINNWNESIRSMDDVYVIGDFIFGRAERQAERLTGIVRQVKGNIFLVKGSHDKLASYDPMTLGKDARRFHLFEDRILAITVDGQEIILCHYSMRVWPKSHFNTWHLFGHSHGKLKPWGKSLDVGVDCWDYRPLSFPEVKGIMQTRPDNFNLLRTE